MVAGDAEESRDAERAGCRRRGALSRRRGEVLTAARPDEAFRALADPTRRAILDALAQGAAPVSDLCELFAVTQSAVSQHLKILRDARLVRTVRHGRSIVYHLDAEPLRAVYDWTAHYQRFWNAKLDALGTVLDREAARLRKVPRA